MKRLAALLGAVGVIGFAAPAHAEPEGDDAAFLANLDSSGITYSSPSQVITSAKAVCGLMGRGETGLQVVSDIKDQNPGMTMDAAAKFAALASSAYCPHHITPKAG
ncbi:MULTISPECIES: DUF732 domain-containing protein [Mycobacterium avium complex (MAC)]|uniref:DUF732 domain-containing protein n=2 Tax=Mycobacterium intracellulare TaxID=1767 RepID=A0AAE4RF90_MYCIT|nr:MULTISPECIES: DUF732 domain-containing protein [Mycobacterium avium complex (MAC)]AFS14673.1 Hypothetical protein MIP_03898 [Mycobacterium intracellulare subsp. intracellulare MTCC 9506]MCA2321805.1 DUF732 domain-containing protein [Mycobacterium intracellulare]MCA2342215.1 DUF732 domain-containing protein [Mycobacterium intracellulare]MDV6976286.1 DUF732 domain-containing protein [Mycobacterium intracellulare]MDV6981339.1 DUF732 domain-containing protein [Mycobacterium intracellulare]